MTVHNRDVRMMPHSKRDFLGFVAAFFAIGLTGVSNGTEAQDVVYVKETVVIKDHVGTVSLSAKRIAPQD